MCKYITYIGLGSNLGNKESNINAALQQINLRVGTVVQRSSFYYSKPQGFSSPNNFVNIVAKVETPLSPLQVLFETQAIEREMGRTEKSTFNKATKSFDYHDRPIDIDILLYFDEESSPLILNTSLLTLPHPRMKTRDFVMIPLSELF